MARPPAAAPLTPRAFGFKAKKLNLTEYHSEQDGPIEPWLYGVDLAVENEEFELGAQWPTVDLYLAVDRKLKGNAGQWFKDYHVEMVRQGGRTRREGCTYDVLRDKLLKQYGAREDSEVVRDRLRERRQQPNETFRDYLSALRRIADKVTIAVETMTHCFVSGLSGMAVYHVKDQAYQTPEEAVERAEKVFGADWTEEQARRRAKRSTLERPRGEESAVASGYTVRCNQWLQSPKPA